MTYRKFSMLVSLAGRLTTLTVVAVDVHSAMADVRSAHSEPAVLVQYREV